MEEEAGTKAVLSGPEASGRGARNFGRRPPPGPSGAGPQRRLVRRALGRCCAGVPGPLSEPLPPTPPPPRLGVEAGCAFCGRAAKSLVVRCGLHSLGAPRPITLRAVGWGRAVRSSAGDRTSGRAAVVHLPGVAGKAAWPTRERRRRGRGLVRSRVDMQRRSPAGDSWGPERFPA